MGRVLASERARLGALTHRLGRLDPRAALARDRAALVGLTHRLRSVEKPLIDERRRAFASLEASLRASMRPRLNDARGSLASLAGRLSALSPLSILARGYAIAIHEETGKALLSSSEASVGDRVNVRLAEGQMVVRVEET